MPKTTKSKKVSRKKTTVRPAPNGAAVAETRKGGRPPVNKDLPDDLILNQYQLSDLLVVSQGKFRDLLANRVLVRTSHGKFPLFENVKRYVNHIAVAKRDAGPTRSKEIESTRLTKVKADKEELLYQELDGSLVRTGDVEIAWAKLLVALRQALLTIPSQLDYLLRESSKTERATIVEAAIRKALEVLSDEPEYLAKRDKRLERFEDPEALGEGVSAEG